MLKAKTKSQIDSIFVYIALIIVALLFMLPILWVVRTSLVTKQVAYQIPPDWNAPVTLDNYFTIFRDNHFGGYFLNSLVVSLFSTGISIFLGSMAAFWLARQKKWKTGLRVSILSVQMLPAIVLVVPLFNVMTNIGLKNTYPGLIVTYLSFNLPYVIWMLISFIEAVPEELSDAAEIDGCSKPQTFLHVVFPIIAPGVVAAGVLSFLNSWNEFMFALVLTGNETRTIPVAIAAMETQQGVQIAELCASVVVVIVPVAILSMFVRKYLVQGLSFGSIK